jgi:hypothetical protein
MLSGAEAEARPLMRLLDLTSYVRSSLSYYSERICGNTTTFSNGCWSTWPE